MTNFDTSPLYRTLVGFDRIASLMDQAVRNDGIGYPPFNIEQTGELAYKVEIAVAGFSEADLVIETRDNTLLVSGKRQPQDEGRKFLHRGIAERSFERRFQLADHVVVSGARLENGLLTIDLVREVPEALKPRRIAINGQEPAPAPQVIEGKATRPTKAA